MQLDLANLSWPFSNFADHPAGDPDQTVVIESGASWGWSIQATRGSSVVAGDVARLGGEPGGGIQAAGIRQ